jgi:putative SOS response-associated peptidase YedK
MSPIHSRMPVVVEAADWPVWLGEAEGDPAALLHPAGEDVLRVWPISQRVGSPRNNDASLIEPIELADAC